MIRPKIRVKVNGVSRTALSGETLSELLVRHRVPVEGTAVALNLEVVRKADHDRTRLKDGDEIEIITAVGGG